MLASAQAGGQAGARPQAVDGLVLAEHLAGDGDLVHLGGTVREARPSAPISIPTKGISFDTPSAPCRCRARHDVREHLRHRRLHRGDVPTRR